MKIAVAHLERADFPVIREWIDTKVFPIFREPIDDGQLEMLLTQSKDGRLTDLGLKAVDEDTGQALGFVHVVLDWKNELGHIQQILIGSPELRRQVVGSVLMQHTLGVLFGDHRLHRVQLFVDEVNPSAIAFYKKMGFQVDGFMRESRKVGDTFEGWYCMSLLEREWDA